MSDMMLFDSGARLSTQSILEPWIERRDAAKKNRKQYERQWMVNMHFAAGKQWLKYSPRDHRVLEQKTDERGRPLVTADVLDQYCGTVLGKLAADDFRPELLLLHDDTESEMYGDQVNDALDFAWENEAHGDQRLLSLLRILVKSTGTGAIRCRYDRNRGQVVGDVPHRDNGQPILDETDARDFVFARQQQGKSANIRQINEGAITWEVLSGWNILPPPGVEHAVDFPWEIIVRPIELKTLALVYGARAQEVGEADVQALGILGQNETSPYLRTGTDSPTLAGQLKNHALLFTGYKRPDAEHPQGQTVVFSHDDVLLDTVEGLPYTDTPHGPRSGVTYFHWNKLPGRFWSRAFIEPGIDPQKSRNKRLSQVTETIDRGQPKVYVKQGAIPELPKGSPLEVIELRPDAAPPILDTGVAVGGWLYQDIEMQDANVEKALGLKQVSLGNSPSGVSAYSAMALLTENDATKLDVIAQEFKLGIADVTRDTLEAMKQWPSQKQLLLAGDDDRLRAVVFNARQMIPTAYMCKPAKGGTLPRSQAAEVQKVADLWNAAVTAGATVSDPVRWLDWYKRSLDAGQAEDLPDMSQQMSQVHKALLENVVMARTAQPVPVADYDDPAVHIQEHDQELSELAQAAMYGDQQAVAAANAIEQHKQMHLAQAQANQMAAAPAGAQAGAASPDAQFQAFNNARAVRYENAVLAPRPPSVRA